MRKNDYLIVEHKALNNLYDVGTTSITDSYTVAQNTANKQDKTVVIVKVVEIITPQIENQKS
jgi:hypothetical protein